MFRTTLTITALALALTACTTTPSTKTENAAPSQATSSPTRSIDCSDPALSQADYVAGACSIADPVESEEPAPVQTPEFSTAKIGSGDGFTYEDGLEVTVPEVEQFKIGEYAAGGQPGQVGVKVTVRIKNGTPEPVDLSIAQVNLAAGPDGVQADTVFDSEQNLIGGFDGTVAPGRNATAVFGFAVDPENLDVIDVEVEPSFEHSSALFTGSVTD